MADFKKTIDTMMDKEGQMRGEILLSQLYFAERKEGQGAIDRIGGTFKELGYKIDFSEIRAMGWTKIAIGTAVALFGKELFDWEDEDIFQMGTIVPKIITVNKLFFHKITSVDSLLNQADYYWGKICNVGEMEGKKYKNGKIVLKLKDYDFHPVACLFIAGYIQTLFDLYTKGDIEVIEEKCTHQGDNYHQFTIKEK